MYKPRKSKLFGLALKQLLDERNLSQRQFAKQAGLTTDYVSKLVNGGVAEPRQKTLSKITDGLGMTEQELLEYIAQYGKQEAEETVSNPTGSGKREEAIAKPSQESVETYAGSGKNLMSLATSMLEQLSFDEKFKKNITSSYTGYRLKNPGARAKKYLLVLAQRKEDLCISVSKDVLEPHILCLKYYEDDAPDIILGKFWIIPSKEDIFLASMQTHYPTLLDGEITGSFTLNQRAIRFYHNCIDIDDSIDFIESPKEFEVNSLGSHNCYLVINEDKLFPDTLQVCISSREILEELIRYFGEILMEN